MIDAVSGANQSRPDRIAWMPLFPADLLLDPGYRALAPTHRAALLELWAHQWVDGDLPGDPRELAAVLDWRGKHARGALAAVRAILEEFPLRIDGRRAHLGVARARADAEERIRRRRAAGIASAAARKKAVQAELPASGQKVIAAVSRPHRGRIEADGVSVSRCLDGILGAAK